MTSSLKYFEWSDAWVFTVLFSFDDTYEPIELFMIIMAGDMLNHAIFTKQELQQGFKKLQTKGLIEIEGENLRLTEIGLEVKNKSLRKRGGLFSRVDNTLNVMNSPRLKLPEIPAELIDTLDFLTDDNMDAAYKKYNAAFHNLRKK